MAKSHWLVEVLTLRSMCIAPSDICEIILNDPLFAHINNKRHNYYHEPNIKSHLRNASFIKLEKVTRRLADTFQELNQLCLE